MVITREEIVSIKGKRSKRPRLSSPVEDDEEMANCLILLAKGKPEISCYRCKTCDKSFSSFQALGGHRANHTKLSLDDGESTNLSLKIPTPAKVRVHDCYLCGAEFSSGQALGGHMRRHRPLPKAAAGQKKPVTVLLLDLNLPAPEVFQEQVTMPNASSLVDCHY